MQHPGAAAGEPRQRLSQVAEALGLQLDDAAAGRLLAYLQLLQRWNGVYNLTALRDPALMFSHHLVDCLAVVSPLRRWWSGCQHCQPVGGQVGPGAPDGASPGLRLLDVGSGGGLPGVVLAALQPGWRVDCVDTVGKKAGFIRQVAAELPLRNLQGLHARVEKLAPPAAITQGGPAGYQVITSRAFASLADFTRLSAHLLAPQGVWMAMKGKAPDDELAQLPADIEVFHVEQLRVPGVDAQRCLVWLRRLPV